MLAFDAHSPTPRVSVGGPLPEPLAAKVHRIVVEAQRNLPAMCEVEFWDEDGSVADNPLLRPGQPLAVEAAPATEDPTARSLGPVFAGEVVALEAAFTPQGTRTTLRGYDRSHRLHRTRRTQTFVMMQDSAVVTKVAAAAGITARVDPTPGLNPYLCQRNQTDWEFLAERAREIGFELSFSKGQLVFRRGGPDPLAGPPQILELGRDLQWFRPRITSAEQPSTTKVRAFNPRLKTPVLGVGPAPVPENAAGDATLGPQTVAASFGTAEDVESHIPLDVQPAAVQRAQARRNHLAGLAFEAEGQCIGNPALRPGAKVTVRNAGKRFSGSYTLTTVRHTFDEQGFATRFTISGRHDRSLLGLTRPGAALRAGNQVDGVKLTGPVIGKVTDNNDPFRLGRVKVAFPWLDDRAESHWAPVVSPGGGPQRGWQVTPEVHDEVLVVFEHGDVRRPYVLGGIHNAKDIPPQPVAGVVAGGRTNIRRFRTRIGHVVELVDTPGQEAITIQTHQGSKLVIQEGPTAAITVVDRSGQNEISIDGAANQISLKAAGNVTIEANANLELKAKGRLTLEGQAGVDVKSATALTADGGASTTIKGAAMSVRSSGPMTVQGNPIKLN